VKRIGCANCSNLSPQTHPRAATVATARRFVNSCAGTHFRSTPITARKIMSNLICLSARPHPPGWPLQPVASAVLTACIGKSILMEANVLRTLTTDRQCTCTTGVLEGRKPRIFEFKASKKEHARAQRPALVPRRCARIMAKLAAQRTLEHRRFACTYAPCICISSKERAAAGGGCSEALRIMCASPS